MNDVKQAVLAILNEYVVVDVNTIPQGESLADLGIDSLSLVEIIFDIEEFFDINIPQEAELEAGGFSLTGFDDVVKLVESLTREQQG